MDSTKKAEAGLDGAQEIRVGEELNLEALTHYLQSRGLEFSGPLVLQQFRKGYSNLTYLVRVGDRDLVLRRPPFGAKIKSAHDMGREFKILSGLAPIFSKVPKPVLFCEDEVVLGAPFYLMERVEGLILRSEPPAGVELNPPLMRSISEAFIATLAEIHQLDARQAGLQELGKPEGYVTRQVEGWAKRYIKAKTDDLPEMESVAAWLMAHKPIETGASLIHNDFKYDNIVLDSTDPSKVRACLDWEMATLGDPAMDLGSTLGYWVDADDPEDWRTQAFGLTTLPGNFNREELLHHYERLSGRTLEKPVFYYVYGMFKLAVIVQQIYARYKAGFTKDERFARLILLVRSGSKLAQRAIDARRITRLG